MTWLIVIPILTGIAVALARLVSKDRILHHGIFPPIVFVAAIWILLVGNSAMTHLDPRGAEIWLPFEFYLAVCLIGTPVWFIAGLLIATPVSLITYRLLDSLRQKVTVLAAR